LNKSAKTDALIAREEETLKAAVLKAMEALDAAATHANIRNYKSAKKELQDYQDKKSDMEKFKTQSAALEYLQRNWKIEKSKLSKDVAEGKCPRKDGLFSSKDLDFYAAAVHLPGKNSTPVTNNDGGDRLKNAMADEREIRVRILRGDLIDAAEEEARDAKLWAAIKADIYNNAAAIIHELINLALPVISSDDDRARLLARTHDLRTSFEDMIDDMFDRYADIEE